MYGISSIIVCLLIAVARGESSNPCEIAPDDPGCANDGKCIVISESDYKCECSSDFTGEFCQLKNLCKYSPCKNGGSCQTFDDTAVCTCPSGYTGNHCEEGQENVKGKQKVSIPATISTTSSKPNVTEMMGRLIARKKSMPMAAEILLLRPQRRGWTNPNAVCNSTTPCNNGGICDDFWCLCNGTGFRGPTCLLVDECHNRCSGHGKCVLEEVSVGSGIFEPKCNCIFGFGDPDCDKKIVQHPCETDFTNGCKNGGSCKNISGTEAECVCPKEYIGPSCEQLNPCKNILCAHGEPTEAIDGGTKCRCICDKLFSGNLCEHDNPCEKGVSHCKHGGICRPVDDGTFYCDCKIGYIDKYCRNRDPCALGGNDVCQNGATCERRDDFEIACQCRIPFEGEHCETLNLCNIDPDECIDDIETKVGNCYPCKPNSECKQIDKSEDKYTCLCPDGLTGPTCETLLLDDQFETPTHLKIFERGKFYMVLINPSIMDDYDWLLDTKRRSNSKKHVTPKMMLTRRDKPPGMIRKEHTFEHYYTAAGIYEVEVHRINRKTKFNEVVWVASIIVDDDAVCYTCEPNHGMLSSELHIVHNWVIPGIVLSAVLIYLILLVLTCFCHWKSRRKRPRLIVATDIQKFDEETFYLLTLQTGNRFDGGTSANVACRFYGEKGRSKIYVLRDHKLDTTWRDSETNYLISSEKHLGEMEKIRIWHDNTGYHPSWYCLKIILREVKVEKYWYFFIRRWLSITSDDTSIVAEAGTATDKEVQNYYNEFTHVSNLWLLTKKHHIWISPFLGSSKSGFTVPERVTVAMVLFCCHMFFLILLHGTPHDLNSGFVFQWGLFKFTGQNVIHSLIIAPFTIAIGYIFTYLFRTLHKKRVPTLLIWRNKPDMPSFEEYQVNLAAEASTRKRKMTLHPIELKGQDSESIAKIYPSSDDDNVCTEISTTKYEERESSEEEDVDEERWDKLDPNRIMVVGVPQAPSSVNLNSESNNQYIFEIPSSTTSSDEVFRIPSTDRLETRNWISEALDDSQGPVNIAPIDLVRTVRVEKPFPGPDRLVELGMVGGVTSVKDDHPESFVYRINSGDNIEHLIEEDVRKSYINPVTTRSMGYNSRKMGKVPVSKVNVVIPKESLETCDENIQTDPTMRRRKLRKHIIEESASGRAFIPVNPVSISTSHNQIIPTDIIPIQIAAMDGVCCGEYFHNTKKVYVELCEMPLEGRRNKSLSVIAWILSFFVIILTTSLTIVFGRRYGRLRYDNWCASLGWGILESFFIFQPLKILFVGYILLHFVEKGTRLPPAIRHNRERFQLYCVNGLTVLPRIYHLNYQFHKPDILYRPVIASQIFTWKMESRRKRLLRNGLREVVIFVIFIIVLTILAMYQRGQNANFYDSAKTIEDSLLLKEDHAKLNPLAYKNIKTANEFYKYLNEVFIKGVYNERDHNGGILTVDPADVTVWMYDKVSILIGIPRIRQLRIVHTNEADEKTGVPGTCDMRYQFKADKFTHPTTNFSCSTDFHDGWFFSNKDTKDYLQGWLTVPLSSSKRTGRAMPPPPQTINNIWRFRTADENLSIEKVGSVSWYDGSGYVTELGRVEAISEDHVRYMKEFQWIDERTRALFIEFSAYNPHVNIFNSVTLLIERTASLKWIASSQILTSQLSNLGTTHPGNNLVWWCEIVSLTIFIACTIYFSVTSMYCFVNGCQRSGMETLKKIWLWIDILIPICCITSLVLLWISINVINKTLDKIFKSAPSKYVDTSQAINMTYIQMYTFCAIMVLSVCKLWHLLVISSRSVFVIGFVFSITTSYSMHFLLIFLILHLAFASFNFIAFGTRDGRCVTFGSAVLNSLYASRFPEDLGFDNLDESDSYFGPIFYFAYNFLIYIFIMNVFISIYTLGLQEAKETALQRPFNSSYVAYIWTKLQGFLPRRLRQKLINKSHITPARFNEMRRIAITTLRAAQNSPPPTEVKMMEMRSVATKFLRGTGLCLVSKQQKMLLKQKKIMLIEEHRLNTMRELTANYIRSKQNISFTVEELKKYEDFDYEILKIQLKKLEKKLIIIDKLLSNILQSM